MKTVDFEYIQRYWLEKAWTSQETFNLYIDCPFCVQQCKFCNHFGAKAAINSLEYNLYYNKLLIEQIQKYKKILDSHTIDSVYFGGGTPSLMTADIMKNIFDSIPNMHKIKSKHFEAHPAFLTKQKIDILADYGFEFLSMGVQSFNERVIRENNRIFVKEDKLKDLIDYAQNEKKLHVNCDLLTFIDTGQACDMDFFEQDLIKMEEIFKPNIITIYPKYERFYLGFELTDPKGLTKAQLESDLNKIIALRRAIIKFCRKSREYKLCEQIPMLGREQIATTYYLNDYRLLRIPRDEYSRVKTYSCSSYPFQPSNQNTIGLGGYGDRPVYSYQGNKLYYYTKIIENDFVINIHEDLGGSNVKS